MARDVLGPNPDLFGQPSVNVKDFGAVGDNVTDDTAALQRALDSVDAVGGGVVYAPSGTYLITSALTIGSNTLFELGSPHAVIKRNAAIDNMLRNKSDGVTGGYGQASYIMVRGGTWDANMAGFASVVCAMAFGHAQYVRIHDCTIKNITGYHHIEFNAVQHGEARGVTFLDYDDVTVNKEMLQIDLALNSGAFPWFGPYDNTPCDDILVDGNTFVNGARGVGSHSTATGQLHKNVKIVNNDFRDMSEQAVYLYGHAATLVRGNTMTDCFTGIKIFADASSDTSEGHKLLGNTIKSGKAASRGIHLDGVDATNRRVRNVVIADNDITGMLSHGVGADFCRDISIRGNTIRSNISTGLWVFKTAACTVDGNFIKSNGFDMTVGNTTGSVNDTTDVVVSSGNQIGSFFINDSGGGGLVNRVVVTQNVLTSYTVNGTPTAVQKFNNFIAGTWTA